MRSVPRLAPWAAQVRHADARDHRRVAKDCWHSGEMIKESDSRAKKNRRDVDMEFVEKAGIQLGAGWVDAPEGPHADRGRNGGSTRRGSTHRRPA
jgi:hypothetical protein